MHRNMAAKSAEIEQSPIYPLSMARHVHPSQERLMFPSWSASADDLPRGHIPIWRRIWRPRHDSKVWTRRALILAAIFIILWIVKRNPATHESILNSLQSRTELKELGIPDYARPQLLSDNPWRGAGRRARKDLVVSVSGCGGSFRKAISIGDNASVRYSIRSIDGKLLDSSTSKADLLVGSGQVDEEMDRKLLGLCTGEAVRFQANDGRKVLLYIEHVGSKIKNVRFVENKLAKLVTTLAGRKGQSCSSTCGRVGFVCEEKGFLVVNNCPRLRENFQCVRCEAAAAGSSGADMPALVVKSAPIGHARGACLVTPNAAESKCNARYMYTRRLCPCFEEGAVKKVMELDRRRV